MMRSFIGAALALALATTAHAQSNPGFVPGQVPSSTQWNGYFSAKVDLPAGITTGHCLMWGPGIADAGVTCGGGGSGGLIVGTSTITSGTSGDVEFNNAGVLGEFALGANVRTSLGVALNASGGINSPSPTRAGDIDLWNGTAWTTLAGNNSGTLCLEESASGVPSWAACGGGSSGLTVGTTTISGGTSGDIEFNNAGVLGELATTGSGSVVRATSPALVTPALGTPSSATLTNATGLPIATGVSGLGTGVATALAAAPTGSGGAVLATSPTLVTPALGTPSAGVLTHATGLPVSTGVSGLGSGVATALGASLNASGGIPAPTPAAAGDIIYWNGTAWVKFAGNTGSTNFLSESASGVPSWAAGSASGVSSLSTTCPATGPSTGAVTLTNGIPFTAKTATYAFAATDCGGWFGFTVTSTTAVSLPASPGSGFYLSAIENAQSSTANLTVTPASGTIDGATSLSLPPGSSVAVVFDGTNYQVTNGVGLDILVFTTVGTSTYTPNHSLVYADLACIGPGGGGASGGISASGTAATGGGGGGSGATKLRRLTAAEVGTSGITVTIAPGGAAGAAVSAAGSGLPGTFSTSLVNIGSLLGCAGGGGGGAGEGSAVVGGGGGGAGLFNGGTNGTTASGSNGNGGGGGGATGFPALPGGGAAGSGSSATGGAGALGTSLANSGAGASGGGVTSATVASTGGQGGDTFGANLVLNGGTAGTVNGNGGNGLTGLLSDGLFALNGIGIIGGSAGGSGGSSITTNGGSAGTSGFGAGGSGGGAACVGGTCPATGSSGAGGVGGGGAVEIWEFNK